MRLIDADKIPYVKSEDGVLEDFVYRYDINALPTVEAAPVVTCGMCRYHKPIDFCELHRQTGWFNDQFCSRGARMNLPEGETR